MKTIYTFAILIFLSLQIFGQTGNADSEFQKANELYANGKYYEAAGIYEKLASEGYNEPALFFNAGNTFYRLNQTGKAIYYYEKANMLNPGNEDIKYNLELAKLRIKNPVPEVPDMLFVKIFKKIAFLFSSNTWAIITLILFMLLLSVIYVFLITANSKTKKISFLSGIISLFLFIMSFIFSEYNISTLKSHNTAIIITEKTEGKSAPEENAGNLFDIYEGYKVKTESKNGDWYEIKLSDGRKAWVKKENLMIL